MPSVEKQYLSLGEKVNGDPLSVPIFTVEGELPGPEVYIQANMHGAEVQGNAVIYQLMEQLKQFEVQGTITMVPFANPIGCNGKSGEYTLGRYDPVTGNNWNRHYLCDTSWIAEFAEQVQGDSVTDIKAAFRHKLMSQLSQKLANPYGVATTTLVDLSVQKLAINADIVLDLHTGPISAAHLYCPEYAREQAVHFNIPHVLLIPNEFDGALDEACFCPWWTLQQELQKLGREEVTWVDAFTIELGSQEQIDLNQAVADATSILAYLSHKGVILEKTEGGKVLPLAIKRTACYLADYKVIYAKRGGLIEYCTQPGEHRQKGDILAKQVCLQDYPAKDAISDITAEQDMIAVLHYPSASVYPGAGLYKVMTNYFTL